MRMWKYFAGAAALAAGALLWAAWTGVNGDRPRHVPAGLVASVTAVAAHSLVILFMILTGRVLKEAMRSRPLGPGFLAELNAFFARKRAYPVALLAVLVTVVAAVLGYGHRGFGISPAWHMAAGVLALAFNLWALPVELSVLRENQGLVDRAASELDRIDRELGPAAARTEPEGPPPSATRVGLSIAIGAWLPYLYWALIVWKGRFGNVPVVPFAAASAAGLVVCALGLRRRRAA
jgi:hypothetical protein